MWSGGLRVSSNAGEQYVSGLDDFVESVTFLNRADIGKNWYERLKQEMTELENLSKIVYGSTIGYFNDQKAEGKNEAAQATHLFWQLCERRFQDLVYACADNTEIEKREKLHQTFKQFVNTAYNAYCPNQTAKQLNAWAGNLPRFAKSPKQNNQQNEVSV